MTMEPLRQEGVQTLRDFLKRSTSCRICPCGCHGDVTELNYNPYVSTQEDIQDVWRLPAAV